jgi:hypothetical protein
LKTINFSIHNIVVKRIDMNQVLGFFSIILFSNVLGLSLCKL